MNTSNKILIVGWYVVVIIITLLGVLGYVGFPLLGLPMGCLLVHAVNEIVDTLVK